MWSPDRESYSVSTRSLSLRPLAVDPPGLIALFGGGRLQLNLPALQLAVSTTPNMGQMAACLPLGHSLGRRALARACVEVMNWRSALRPNPSPPYLITSLRCLPGSDVE